MNDSKWRLYLVLFLVVVSAYVILPSFINLEKAPYWISKVLPEQKLKLGGYDI